MAVSPLPKFSAEIVPSPSNAVKIARLRKV
jgi:hypothetical protein